MSPAVVHLPDTVLMVPGAGGRHDPVARLRAAAVSALTVGARSAARVDADTDRPGVLVLAPGPADRVLTELRPGLGAAGLPDALLAAAASTSPGAALAGRRPAPALTPDCPVAGVPASTALVLLTRAGVPGPVQVAEVTPGGPAPDVRLPGLVVVVGSLSARHGPDAPLPDDPRAPAVDEALTAALAAGPDALWGALDSLGDGVAAALAVTALGPWRALRALLGAPPVEAGPVLVEVVAGACHAVASWRATSPAPGAGRTERSGGTA